MAQELHNLSGVRLRTRAFPVPRGEAGRRCLPCQRGLASDSCVQPPCGAEREKVRRHTGGVLMDECGQRGLERAGLE